MTIWVSGRLWRQLGIVRESEKGGGKQAAWRPISESDEIIAIAQYVYSKGLAYIVRRKERIKGSDTRKIRKLVNYVIHPTKEMLAGSQGIASKEVYQGKFGWWSLEAVDKYFSGIDILNRRTYVSRVFKAEGYKLGSSLNWDLGHPSYPGLTISVEPGKKQGQ